MHQNHTHTLPVRVSKKSDADLREKLKAINKARAKSAQLDREFWQRWSGLTEGMR